MTTPSSRIRCLRMDKLLPLQRPDPSMDAERMLTISLVAFVAGSVTLFVVLIVVGALTDGADLLRFGLAGLAGLVVAVAVGLTVQRNASPEQLTGR